MAGALLRLSTSGKPVSGGLVNVTLDMFFDWPAIQAAVNNKNDRVLSSTGAFARTVMKRGMRKRKGVSAPGAYPSSHVGDLRNLIYFGYDASTQSVVVGPTLFRKDRELTGSTKTVPELINEGGTVFRVSKTGRGRRTRLLGAHVRQTYRPRPFIDLTLPAAADKLAENMEKFDLK